MLFQCQRRIIRGWTDLEGIRYVVPAIATRGKISLRSAGIVVQLVVVVIWHTKNGNLTIELHFLCCGSSLTHSLVIGYQDSIALV